MDVLLNERSSQRKWKDISISKKIYFLFGGLLSIIFIESVVLYTSIQTLSSVRALVAAEGKWSRAQKSAMNQIHSYMISKDPIHFYAFQKSLEKIKGVQEARKEIESNHPNYEIFYSGLTKIGNHPEDVPGMFYILYNFKNFEPIKKPIEIWATADKNIAELWRVGQNLHEKFLSQNDQEADIQLAQAKLEVLDGRLSSLENDFSESLSLGARNMEGLIFTSVLMSVLLLGSLFSIFVIRFTRELKRNFKKIEVSTSKIGHGDLKERILIDQENELGQIATAINQMVEELVDHISKRKEAEDLNKVKSLFLANMSHEIRTPLASILGYTDLLSKSDLSESERSEYISVIQKAGASLAEVIDDILDITKIESGQLKIEPLDFSLYILLEDLQRLFRYKCLEKGIRLVFNLSSNLPDFIHTDPLRLKQIIINLLSNGIKFTNEGEVRLFASKEGDELVFDVIDTGIGICGSDRKEIFKKFRQSKNQYVRNHGGTGLGLPLASELSHLLGGKLELIDSKLDKGSHFQARIKYERGLSDSPISNALNDLEWLESPSEEFSDATILVVDDSEELRNLTGVFLQPLGCKIEFAEDGFAALEKVRKMKFDLILLDLQMPKMSGIDAMIEMKKMGISVPVIAQTAHAMVEEKQDCLKMGFTDVITKPIQKQTFTRVISEYLQH